jgi:hypothetical protein
MWRTLKTWRFSFKYLHYFADSRWFQQNCSSQRFLFLVLGHWKEVSPIFNRKITIPSRRRPWLLPAACQLKSDVAREFPLGGANSRALCRSAPNASRLRLPLGGGGGGGGGSRRRRTSSVRGRAAQPRPGAAIAPPAELAHAPPVQDQSHSNHRWPMPRLCRSVAQQPSRASRWPGGRARQRQRGAWRRRQVGAFLKIIGSRSIITVQIGGFLKILWGVM